jgi:chemotaxis protein MotB
MARKKGGDKKIEEDESWLLTYADFITLLMGFFVMMFSISKIDAVKLEQIQSSISKQVGKVDPEKPLQSLKTDLREVVRDMAMDDSIGIGTDEDGITIEFASSAFYKPGSAELKPEAEPVMRRLAVILNGERYAPFQVEAQGHTDDTPVQTQQYPSNWELSAGRATAVVRLFLDAKVSPARMRAVGYADVMPKVPNRDPNGNPLAANQSINRRVVVKVMPR